MDREREREVVRRDVCRGIRRILNCFISVVAHDSREGAFVITYVCPSSHVIAMPRDQMGHEAVGEM